MTTNILLVTHKGLGQAFFDTIDMTFDHNLPLNVHFHEVCPHSDAETELEALQAEITSLLDHDSLLILTDLYGSTPSNLCQQIKGHQNVEIICGLNLPMLIRVLNYPQLSLTELAQKALTGGCDGIIDCNSKQNTQ